MRPFDVGPTPGEQKRSGERPCLGETADEMGALGSEVGIDVMRDLPGVVAQPDPAIEIAAPSHTSRASASPANTRQSRT